MAEIKKIYDDAERTIQIYPKTHERAVVDNNGTTAETKFQMIADLVNQKQMEIGAVPSDIAPTKGSTKWVTSGGLYDSVGVVQTPMDLSLYVAVNISSAPSKQWSTIYYGIFVPVEPNETYNICANANACIFIPLKSCEFASGDSYADNIATGYTDRVVLVANTFVEITIPSDCYCLYIQTTSGSGDMTPTLTKIDANKPTESLTLKGSSVSGVGMFKENEALVELPYRVYSKYLDAEMKWCGITGYYSALHYVNGEKMVHIVGNDNYNSKYAFLHTINLSTGYKPDTVSTFVSIPAGQSMDVEVPSTAYWLYVVYSDSNGVVYPKWVQKYKSTAEDVKDLSNTKRVVTLLGTDTYVSQVAMKMEGGRVYYINLPTTSWNVSSVGANQIFGLYKNGVQFVTILNDGSIPKERYIVYSHDDWELKIVARATIGTNVTVEIEDVTSDYKDYQPIGFVNGESFMFKVQNGEFFKYRLNAEEDDVAVKIYSRAVQSDTYLLDSFTASSDGVIEGSYMPNQDVFVVAQNVTLSGFTPKLEIVRRGYPKYNLTSPYQLIFDKEHETTILSSEDANASTYDNVRINYGCIIPVGTKYYMIYQGFGTWRSGSSAWLMAYSNDGLTWTRGIPDGIEAPYPNTNVIFKSGTIVGEFATETVNEMSIVKVNDAEYPYRMFTMIRNDNPSTIVGECGYFFKSADLVHWTKIRKITNTAHDSFSNMISYGDKIKVYFRMWDYQQELTNMRMIGYMWIDIEGNVLVPPTGLFGQGMYNPSVTRIDSNKELFLPTHFHITSGMSGDAVLEAYMKVDDDVRYVPTYGLDAIKEGDDHWIWALPLQSIGRNQYMFYTRANNQHGGTITQQEMRMCPVKWVTYNSSNQDSGVTTWG